jgi:ABC-type multidrug transport system ATPase subunit
MDRRRVPGALERVGMARDARERVRGFSQGMRQRVALCRAIIRRPELLLLDEPYAGLDADAKDLVDAIVGETVNRNGTVLLATHDETRGLSASRVMHMDQGRIVAETPSEPWVVR